MTDRPATPKTKNRVIKLTGFDTYAVVLTHNRHEWANQLLGVLLDDGVTPFVIDNRSEPPFVADNRDVVVIRDDNPMNISALWNQGLEIVERDARRRELEYWNVAVLNDDLDMPHGALDELGFAMRAYEADASFPDVHGMQPFAKLHRDVGFTPISLFERVSGFCFMLPGERGLRADPQFEFWYGDDDIDWRVRAGRGSVQVPLRNPIRHLDADGTYTRDPEAAEQAGRDRQSFIVKYGQPPW